MFFKINIIFLLLFFFNINNYIMIKKQNKKKKTIKKKTIKKTNNIQKMICLHPRTFKTPTFFIKYYLIFLHIMVLN